MAKNKKRYFVSFERYKNVFLGFETHKNSKNKSTIDGNIEITRSDCDRKNVLQEKMHNPNTSQTNNDKNSYPQNKQLEGKNAKDAGDCVFSEIATIDSIKRFPFFSGIILSYSGPFHESFMLDVPITVLILPSEFRVVAVQKGILKLKDLMFRDYTEFVYYPKIGNIIIEQVQRAIIDFVLFSNQLERIRDGETQHLLSSPEELAKCCFFSGSAYIKLPELRAIDVYSLDFSVRFHNNLKKLSFVHTLEDLLNTDQEYLLKLRNCGSKTIEDAKRVILDFLSGSRLSTDTKDIGAYDRKGTFPFLANNSIIFENIENHIINTDLRLLKLPKRFLNLLKKRNDLVVIEDLLKKDANEFLGVANIGSLTLNKVKDTIIDYLLHPERRVEEPVEAEEPFLDLRLVKRLGRALQSERNLKIFLLRYGYEVGNDLTLDEIGEKFGLTRERIRQILLQAQRRIIRNKYTLEEVAFLVKTMDYVVALSTLVDKLIEERIWGQTNPKFLIMLLTEFLGKRYGLILENGHLVNHEVEGIETIFEKINSEVTNIVNLLNDGIRIEELLMILKGKIDFRNVNTDRLVTRDTIVYLSEKFRSFHICDSVVYNETGYQIREGKYLQDVVYHSLKYLSEPSHFEVLADFIRAHNKKYRDTENNSVHSTLVRTDYCHDVDRGVYALKEWNIPKHLTVWEALKILLRKQGPMLEEKIIDELIRNYNIWNIRMAIENNRNKLLQIGNNMFDLKEDIYEGN